MQQNWEFCCNVRNKTKLCTSNAGQVYDRERYRSTLRRSDFITVLCEKWLCPSPDKSEPTHSQEFAPSEVGQK